MNTQNSFRKFALRLMSAAALAAFVLPVAHANVVTVNFSSNPLSVVPFTVDGVYLNVVTGAASTSAITGWDVSAYFITSLPRQAFFPNSGGGTVGAAGAARYLVSGDVVGPTSGFLTGAAGAAYTSSGISNVGFRFLNEATGSINYGYLTLAQTAPVGPGSVQILSYSYENNGSPITVTTSPVPEPATALMLVAGLLAGGAAMRRKGAGANT